MTEALPPDQVRADDADRKIVEQRLRDAHEGGSLDLAEFDERLGNVWSAKTRGDLARITADLPAPKPVAKAVPWTERGDGYVAMRVLSVIWLSLSAVSFVIWLLVALSTGNFDLYPWWIWPLVPPGVALGVLWVFGIGRPRQP